MNSNGPRSISRRRVPAAYSALAASTSADCVCPSSLPARCKTFTGPSDLVIVSVSVIEGLHGNGPDYKGSPQPALDSHAIEFGVATALATERRERLASLRKRLGG